VRVIIELEPALGVATALDSDLERLRWSGPARDFGEASPFEIDLEYGLVAARLPSRRRRRERDPDLTGDRGPEEALLDADRMVRETPAEESNRRPRWENRWFCRGSIPDDGAAQVATDLPDRDRRVHRVYADPVIENQAICWGNLTGTASDVAAELHVADLAAQGMTGSGVRVGIVDGGFNIASLKGPGRHNVIDQAASVRFKGMPAPGMQARDHGTMCAFEIGIAAPYAMLVDVPILRGTGILTTLLSDGLVAFVELREKLENGQIALPLVMSNSWALLDPSTDFPVGHEANYSHTPDHAFTLAVEALVDQGADVLFAAGNCGPICPHSRCRFQAGSPSICGANASRPVLSVGAIAVGGLPIGYSPVGGTLGSQKPDVLGYSQFAGSGVDPIDTGTSAACPVVAGVVAAIRTTVSPATLAPRALASIVRATAGSRTIAGTWTPGVIDVPALLNALP
jgi:subtilisin family serine protease